MSCTAELEVLDPEGANTFTNLDVIRGKVHLKLTKETSIKSIVVKLEGVTRTQVAINRHEPRNRDNRRKGVEIETHKVLYKQQTVFPSAKINAASTAKEFTLKAGSYQYDFEMKIPVNSSCGTQPASAFNAQKIADQINEVPIVGAVSRPVMSVSKPVLSRTGIDFAQASSTHIDGVLPPSLSGMGELASVKYFIKVTVNRASFLAINARNYHPFVFLPVDQPRLVDSNRMAFVRRELRVGLYQEEPSSSQKSGMRWFFKDSFGTRPTAQVAFNFEARYPASMDFVPLCRLPLQLCAVFKKDPSTMPISILYLRELELELIASTVARAHQEVRTDSMALKFFERSNLNLALNLEMAQRIDNRGRVYWEISLPESLLEGAQMPDSVCPSFVTCNIKRSYNLKVEAGFSCVPNGRIDYVKLYANVLIRSGIPAPAQSHGSLPGPSTLYEKFNAAPPPFSARPSDQKTAAGPATYQDNEGEQEQSTEDLPSYVQALAHLEGPQDRVNRQYGQSNDYYHNFED